MTPGDVVLVGTGCPWKGMHGLSGVLIQEWDASKGYWLVEFPCCAEICAGLCSPTKVDGHRYVLDPKYLHATGATRPLRVRGPVADRLCRLPGCAKPNSPGARTCWNCGNSV